MTGVQRPWIQNRSPETWSPQQHEVRGSSWLGPVISGCQPNVTKIVLIIQYNTRNGISDRNYCKPVGFEILAWNCCIRFSRSFSHECGFSSQPSCSKSWHQRENHHSEGVHLVVNAHNHTHQHKTHTSEGWLVPLIPNKNHMIGASIGGLIARGHQSKKPIVHSCLWWLPAIPNKNLLRWGILRNHASENSNIFCQSADGCTKGQSCNVSFHTSLVSSTQSKRDLEQSTLDWWFSKVTHQFQGLLLWVWIRKNKREGWIIECIYTYIQYRAITIPYHYITLNYVALHYITSHHIALHTYIYIIYIYI